MAKNSNKIEQRVQNSAIEMTNKVATNSTTTKSKPKQVKHEKAKTIRLMRETLDNSLAHALIKIYETPHPSLKFFLFVCVLVSSGLCSYLIIQLFVEYTNYYVLTTQRTQYEMPVRFPKVIICNINPFTTKYSIEFITSVNRLFKPDYDIFNETQMNELSLNEKSNVINDIYTLARFQMNGLNESEKRKLSHSFENVMQKCLFNFKKCSMNDFEWIFDPWYGNCWQFNADETSMKYSSFPGENFGLKMGFYVNMYENLTRINHNVDSVRGALIRIDNSSHSSDLFALHGIKIAPGYAHDISVSRSFKSKLSAPYSNCLSQNGGFQSDLIDLIQNSTYKYTQPTCLIQCLQRNIHAKCNCTDSSLLSLFSSHESHKMCLTPNEIYCMLDLYEAKLLLDDFFKENCLQICPPECHMQEFDISLSSNQLISNYYLDYLNSNSHLVEDFVKSEEINLEKTRQSFLFFNVFYKSLSYATSIESPEIDIVWLLIGIGSYLGLFMGLSVFSLFEFVQVLIEILFNVKLLLKSRGHNKIEGEVEEEEI